MRRIQVLAFLRCWNICFLNCRFLRHLVFSSAQGEHVLIVGRLGDSSRKFGGTWVVPLPVAISDYYCAVGTCRELREVTLGRTGSTGYMFPILDARSRRETLIPASRSVCGKPIEGKALPRSCSIPLAIGYQVESTRAIPESRASK
jgi:hypothetical protein